MKKLIFTLSILTAISVASFGQACGLTSSCSPKPASGTPGLTPVSDSLPCFSKGWTGTQYIYFENFTTYNLSGQNLTINSLKIDSIENLPKGLCWKTNKANNTWNGGQTGCIEVSGTVLGTNAPGQYKLRIIATIATSIATLPLQDVEALAGLRYYVRVNCSGQACPAVDSATGSTQAFIAYNGQSCTGVDEVSQNISSLSIMPNPLTSSATVSFVADKEEKYTARLSNILGTTVYNTEIVANIGENNIKLNRNGYAAGVYFFTIANGKSSITRRVVIE